MTLVRDGRKATSYFDETVSRTASKEHREAAAALVRLRAENRRNTGRPCRAMSLAEAEAQAGQRDQGATPVGILREFALTGKSGAVSQPRRTVK